MTKKDYGLVSKAIAGIEYIGIDTISKGDLVKALNKAFLADNPRFDGDKFFRVCYPLDPLTGEVND